MNATEVLNVLKTKWYILILIPILFAIGTAVYSYVFVPNIYTSSVPLYVWQRVDNTQNTEESANNNNTNSSSNNKSSNNTNSNNNNNNTKNNNSTNSKNNSSSSNNTDNNSNTSEEDPRKSVQNDINFNNLIANDIQNFIKSNMITKAVMEELGLSSLSDYTITTNADSKNTSSKNTASRILNITVSGNDSVATAQIANCYAKKTSEIVTKFINVDAINVLEEAQPSEKPSGPPRELYIVAATAAGLCLAIVVILIISYFDSSIKNKKELEKITKLPVLSQIPYIKKAK